MSLHTSPTLQNGLRLCIVHSWVENIARVQPHTHGKVVLLHCSVNDLHNNLLCKGLLERQLECHVTIAVCITVYRPNAHKTCTHTHTHTHTHQDLHNLIQGLSAHGACQMRCTVGPIAAIAPCNGSLSSRRGSPDMWALNLTRATPFHWQLWSKSPAQRAVAIPLDSLKGCGEAWPEER